MSRELEAALRRSREELLRRQALRARLEEELADLRRQTEECAARQELWELTRQLLSRAAEFARERSRRRIEELVTGALGYVFGTDLAFGIRLEERGGRPEAEFLVVSRPGGMTLENRPEDARGGGVVDLVALALRVALLQSTRPVNAGPLVLDEPAKHVSEEYIVGVGQFLRYVASLFERQVLMVTHNPHLAELADRSFRVELVDGVSRVSRA